MLTYNLISSPGFKICHTLSKKQIAFFSTYRQYWYVRCNLLIGSLPGLWNICYFVGFFWIERVSKQKTSTPKVLVLWRWVNCFFHLSSFASATIFRVGMSFFPHALAGGIALFYRSSELASLVLSLHDLNLS